jgi:hypothetical protein
MDISYLSIIIFLVITYVYYAFPAIGKINMTIGALKANNFESIKKNYSRLGLYLLFIIVSQFALNSMFLINKCGGGAGQNIDTAAMLTFFPWFFIFGILIFVIIMYPSLKTAFADVVGYFAIAGKANEILTSILIDVDVEENIEKGGISESDKLSLKKAAEAVLKLCGNKSIIINKMNPLNFLDIWNMLVPLMKNNGEIPDLQEIQNKLYNLVILKDNVGEAIWYIYTAILITSIVSYNLSIKSCKKSLDQLKADHDKYLEDEEKINQQNELNNSTPAVITG